jgi:hypothetical protein
MVEGSELRAGMPVLAADGEPLGTVDAIEGQRLRLARRGDDDGRYLPLVWISRINGHVHLKRTAAEIRASWGLRGGDVEAALAGPGGPGRATWLPWLLVAAAAATLVYAVLP